MPCYSHHCWSILGTSDLYLGCFQKQGYPKITLYLETTNLGWIIQVFFLTISKQATNQAPEQWMERMSDFESQVSSQIQAVNLEQLMTGVVATHDWVVVSPAWEDDPNWCTFWKTGWNHPLYEILEFFLWLHVIGNARFRDTFLLFKHIQAGFCRKRDLWDQSFMICNIIFLYRTSQASKSQTLELEALSHDVEKKIAFLGSQCHSCIGTVTPKTLHPLKLGLL